MNAPERAHVSPWCHTLGLMWARVARFEGDPADIEARLERLRSVIDGGTLAEELADARLLMLVDRESGGMIGVSLFDSEEAMRKADEAMNAGPGNAGRRSSVEFYEVPLHTL
jgi:hypothetical protein